MCKDKILVAVSGGLDSMVMLHLFRVSGYEISVAHANFQLRGNESEGDEKFVKEICKKFSIPFFVKRFSTKQFAESNFLSTQMAARQLRYVWFNELIEQENFDVAATAHHVNDSIETVLLNFVRGSGLEGLDGIAAKNGKIIRPLLFATRKQIEWHANENKIEWREDRSNATDDYQRNFVRHKIYPLLKEINPSLENSFQDSIEKNSGAVDLMSWGINYWQEKYQTKKNEQVHLSKKGFDESKNKTGLLWNLIKSYGFNFDQCGQIIESIDGQSGKKFRSSHFELSLDRELIIISPLSVGQGWDEILIEMDQTEAKLGKQILKIIETKKIIFENNPSVALLDADKLQFPLCWRKWNPGDFFYPLGMSHKKKLSDFLIDQKVSLADKETVTVLESGNEIVWVVGMRVDDRYKITATTKSTVVCQQSIID